MHPSSDAENLAVDEFHFELAAKVEEAERENGIYNARLKESKAHVRPDDFTGECECGVSIPMLRVKAGYYRCVDCVRATELKERLRT